MENQIEINGHEIIVHKRYDNLIVISVYGFNALRMEDSEFHEIKSGTVVYDAIENDTGSMVFKIDGDDSYYISTSKSHFAEFTEDVIESVKEMANLLELRREISDKINNIENSIKPL